ncbi:MAG: phosphoribosylformylglycinamidine synthase [Treponema sp.]|nr:phosphoribosylformylglycinamidine synthase [Treponema sp.]
MFRLYIERKPDFSNEAKRIHSEITGFLGIKAVKVVRYLNRYDIENVSEDVCRDAATRIFSEPQSDICYFTDYPLGKNETSIIWEYLPGQYDQRADSAEQCLSLLIPNADKNAAPKVRCAKLVLLEGNISEDERKKIENYLINPVDSRVASSEIPLTLTMNEMQPDDIPVIDKFTDMSSAELSDLREKMSLAMDNADIAFMQSYFKKEGRNPTETEIRVLDTYWSDHCRHTTFNTMLDDIKIEEGDISAPVVASLAEYRAIRDELYGKRTQKGGANEKPLTLMDMACIGAKYLRKHGKLDDIELSEEINACSIYIDVDTSDYSVGIEPEQKTERWLLQFKNETHNHPTEIEPFGGAATCIGGAIRDPLSGRAWVYQSLRVTGAADPTVPISQTREGKLPQMKLTREAAQGFSSYGNQIGLTTGQVAEFYHPGFEAKRMELGAVIAAVPSDVVKREIPDPGDCIILVGGGTGRDGIGGATGSSKAHNVDSVTTAAAEVQKGNAVEERKIQRLFRIRDVSRMIRRCNDFGAGGVSVAVGELAPGLEINLDSVPKKYEGLNGTELAISESQERMAVVVRKKDVEAFINAAKTENLNAVQIASVTNTNRLVMKWHGKTIVDIDRTFLDTSGASRSAKAVVAAVKKDDSPLCKPLKNVEDFIKENPSSLVDAWLLNMKDFAVCSQRGLTERFDGSIGSSTVIFPMGGVYQSTPENGCVAKIPVLPPFETNTSSLMTFGYDPYVASWSPYHGAQIAVLHSLARIAALGGLPESCRLTFQEYFERTSSEQAWGKPVAALLGALSAQIAMQTASIGGKDSMSGSFAELTVPPTLVSFAVTTEDARNITSGAFKKADSIIYFVPCKYTNDLTPDFASFKNSTKSLHSLTSKKLVNALYPVCAGGIAEAVTKMAFGNKIGLAFNSDFLSKLQDTFPVQSSALFDKNKNSLLFLPFYGSIIAEVPSENSSAFEKALPESFVLGKTTTEQKILVEDTEISIVESYKAWEQPLAKVFPPITEESDDEKKAEILPDFALKTHESLQEARDKAHFLIGSKAKPKVLLPVFPGTNCEFDMARAFSLEGAETKILVFLNKDGKMLESSLNELQKELGTAQILALSGGFSAGDEPDGSGKFIANVLRENRIAQAVISLLEERNGLVLGICNGFQALIKTGLVPYGKILAPSEDMPTLTFNRIGRHISRVVNTRMVSAISPWAQHQSVVQSQTHLVPISHGEGRIIIDKDFAKKLFENGQIFTQYVDENGNPVMTEPTNPNGSMFAIEGMTSPDGRVLGKMGHNERTIGTEHLGASNELIKNIQGNKCQNIFAAGVRYFD